VKSRDVDNRRGEGGSEGSGLLPSPPALGAIYASGYLTKEEEKKPSRLPVVEEVISKCLNPTSILCVSVDC